MMFVEFSCGWWWVVDSNPGPFSRWVDRFATKEVAEAAAQRMNEAKVTK